MRKKILFLLALFFMTICTVSGQTQSNPLDLGTFTRAFEQSCSFSVGTIEDPFYYYRFTTTLPLDITISHCGSTVKTSGIFLVNSESNFVVNGGDLGHCSNSRLAQAVIPSLPAGEYILWVDWEGKTGNLYTMIEGKTPAITTVAKDIGTYDASFSYSDTKDTDIPGVGFTSGFYSGGVSYRFTLNRKMDLNVSHCGSDINRTCIYLLNEEGERLTGIVGEQSLSNCSNPKHANLSVRNLIAGTYYIVSMGGSGAKGLISTNITGVPAWMDAASSDRNYIVTRSYTNASGDTWQDKVEYFDGLGRLEQTVLTGASPTGGDLASLTEYDVFGREQKAWLQAEVKDNCGAYILPSTLKSKTQSSNCGDSKPHSLTEYEMSPLNRPTAQYGAGNDWHSKGKAVKTEYLTNIKNDSRLNCKHYVSKLFPQLGELPDTVVTLKYTESYPTGSLLVTRTTDEDENVTLEFKDRFGQVVLMRSVVGNECFDTYYVYDYFGNLHAVLPPNAINPSEAVGDYFDNVSSSLHFSLRMTHFAYLYVYDNRNRVIGKRLPGQGWTRIVYDKSDYPILTQDVGQRKRGEWSFSIPDAMGRVCLVGTCRGVLKKEDETVNLLSGKFPSLSMVVQAARDNKENSYKGYTISGITFSSPKILQVNYYDDYSFMGKNGMPAATNADFKYETTSEYGDFYTGGAQSLLTGTLTAQINWINGVSLPELPSVMYYDYRGRLIQSKSANHLSGGIEKEYLSYDFAGNVLKRKHIHSATGKNTQTELYTYTYDHAGRMLTTKHKLNSNAEVTLVNNEYDALGRLKTNKRNGNVKLKTDYGYNVRSWMKSITGQLFNQTLYYNDKRSNGTNTSRYNGNISAMDWKVNATNDNILRGYDFTYDALSRLTKADYLESNIRKNYFNTAYSYDKHGNILTLKRYGRVGSNSYGVMDDLSFTLEGNLLKSANDVATHSPYNSGFHFKDGAKQSKEYYYDVTGRLTKDLNKNISEIEYNVLNLPQAVKFGDGNEIRYIYGADGRKLSSILKVGVSEIVTNYCGNVIYESNAAKSLLVDGGYVSLNNNAYHFYLQDHQGNHRVVASSAGAVEETNHYYPFGGTFAGTTSIQPYKYNGKELDRKNGLNWYDYGARQYDAALGRFMTVDPLAEKLYSWNPYTYCFNNPVKYVDEDGRLPVLAVPLIKGFVGASCDAVAQVTIALANGSSFSEAVSDIDYTSVGASFVTSAIGVPSMSTARKVVTASFVAADAVVDISSSEGFKSVFDEKSVVSAAVDVAGSVLPGKISDKITSEFTGAITSDLTSKSAATLTKETKASLKQTRALLESKRFDIGMEAVTGFTGGAISGQANKAIEKSNSVGNTTSNASQSVSAKSADAIKVMQNEKPIMYNLWRRR